MSALPASTNKEDTIMTTELNQKYLQEYFKKHDTLTLYKPDGTPVTFQKQYEYVLRGGGSTFRFDNFDALKAFFQKHNISQAPSITVT